jgi:hypothetical protein
MHLIFGFIVRIKIYLQNQVSVQIILYRLAIHTLSEIFKINIEHKDYSLLRVKLSKPVNTYQIYKEPIASTLHREEIYHEDGGGSFLQNTGKYLSGYIASHFKNSNLHNCCRENLGYQISNTELTTKIQTEQEASICSLNLQTDLPIF